jgi:hypothetical protein
MRVRSLDSNGDWTFGQGLLDYKTGNDAIAQSIKTRLNSFLGDCFFNLGAGIDWFNLIGSKNEIGLNLAISTTILNTENVTGILELSTTLDNNRVFTVNYQVQTTYSSLNGTFTYDTGSGV